ncbi:DUF1028 domain-containing protein [Synechococcus sp. CBW1004]|uniref:DUF1028 domain-containing protein n=1 Tax=Synechococcus sp. CBW1004 TaxID=1353136 RepID=UPI0018CF46D7|nr:DUF1028 domain-containing protein [Synechococcus sp. CBW1004]QPN62276.1 DUF1028 domain-containing protein [Synechococcus sp. CBW1004]
MTFSILARDPGNGRFGVAVATFHLAVGSTVPHIRSGVGAVATQAHTNPYLGICGLERLEQNLSAEQVKASLLRDDPQRNLRQFHLIDARGQTAAWTGADCGEWAGHRSREGVAVAGNLLVGEAVLIAMEEAFLTSDPSWKLGRRLIHALHAGEAAGGDRRASHATSAALQVSGEAAFPLLDLRIDYHDQALSELTLLYERSQMHWAQTWRDELAQRPIISRHVA